MKDQMNSGVPATPMLFPFDPARFWTTMRELVREEFNLREKDKPSPVSYETPGLTYCR